MNFYRTFCRTPVAICLSLSVLSAAPGADAAATDKTPRTLHVMLTTQEAALDPAVASDLASLSINENIFDPMLRYDYLARPVRLMPNTLTAMPEITDNGKTYTMHVQPGTFFTSDPAFKGKQRELTAQDYLYSIKRLYDPALKSPWLFMFEGKILGDEKLKAAGKFDINQSIEGLQALDRYTLRIRLQAPDTNFLFQLATPATGAVAREVADAYAEQTGSHPVGTGPFMMGKWQRSFQIELLANPTYRSVMFSSVGGKDARDRKIVSDLQGKRLPRVDRVEIKIMEEAQSQVLGFLNNEFDYLEQVPPPLAEMVLIPGTNIRLKPDLQKKGVQLDLFSTLQTYYVWMNMDDPVIGGYTPDRIALRRAIALSYDSKEDISLMEKGLAIAAQTPLPPNVLGYDPGYRSPLSHDVRLANALLDKFGYRRGADGYRSLPDGQALSLVMHSLASTKGRLRDETWRKNLDAIGIRISFKSDKNSEILKAARLGKVQMTEANWIADFPDGENFYQLLYGPNSGRANYSRFNLPAFNKLYEESRALSDSPERQRLYHDMAQLMHAYTPWIVRIHPLSADVWHPWLKNYKRHPVDFTTWRYLDVDNAEKAATK
ncbi:ABC transporter substrate-binding protein [Undibacterium sp.]|jgi:ABC-type transport system substrate-binding protein|uniref:ABC transporter substrate-binding protein n=1 Tax=Undibacterium sp. TaxID=1914977 RepID=UPI002C20C91B|nr:ABC transporter substrate-binding protein [Undibacterium sp.]HTD06523.1 ABC transporter substrate-binding protein [Undibacterium sp.]